MEEENEGCTYSLRLQNHFIVSKVLLGALNIQFGKPPLKSDASLLEKIMKSVTRANRIFCQIFTAAVLSACTFMAMLLALDLFSLSTENMAIFLFKAIIPVRIIFSTLRIEKLRRNKEIIKDILLDTTANVNFPEILRAPVEEYLREIEGKPWILIITAFFTFLHNIPQIFMGRNVESQNKFLNQLWFLDEDSGLQKFLKLNNGAISVAMLLFGTAIYGFATLQISMISLAVKMIEHVSSVICFIDQKSENHELSEQDKRNAFNYAVQQHQRCIRYVYCINKLFALTTLLDIWTLTFALCLNAHLYVMQPVPIPVSSILQNIIVMALYIGMACWHSDRVTKAGLKISTNCNAMSWWNFDQEMVQDISIMSNVAQMRLTIKAGPMYTLNMRTFLAVLEICLTYFLVLLKFS